MPTTLESCALLSGPYSSIIIVYEKLEPKSTETETPRAFKHGRGLEP